jgi:glycogen phosphorylase
VRSADKGAIGKQVVDWQHAVDRKWNGLRFENVRVQSDAHHHRIEVELLLNDLDPSAVRVELYADGLKGGDPIRQEMKRARTASDAGGRCIYQATIPTTRPASDYTARVIPQRAGAAVPLECARILWQR